MDFSLIPTWVQIWGLPAHCRTKPMGRKIGSFIGEVLEAEIYEFPEKKLINKVKVNLDIGKPLKAGPNAGSSKDGLFGVNFKYEKLPQFYFFRGMIGHGEQGCNLIVQAEKDPLIKSKNLGPWLRTNKLGRKKFDDKDSPRTDFQSNNPGSKHKVSMEVLERFTKLSMKDFKKIEEALLEEEIGLESNFSLDNSRIQNPPEASILINSRKETQISIPKKSSYVAASTVRH